MIREVDYSDGTAQQMAGTEHSGKFSIEENGFNFHNAVGQKSLIELLPSQCRQTDLRQGNIYKVLLTSSISNFDVVYPNLGTYVFIFQQSSTGGKTVTFDSDRFYWMSGVGPPDFSGDSSGTVNIVTFLCDGYNFYGTYIQNFVNS